MTGATITVTNVLPGEAGPNGSVLIYFSVTLDGSAKASFASYDAVHRIDAKDASTLVPEDPTAYTAGGDITFTNNSNAIKGLALVEPAS